MTDLREAQLRQEFRSEIMRGYQATLCNSDVPGWTLGDEVGKVADNLLASVAAHPVEPAPDRQACAAADVGVFTQLPCICGQPVPAQVEITDEAVEAAARAYYTHLGWDWDDLGGWDQDQLRELEHAASKDVILAEFRLSLAAALPYLVPRPLPTAQEIAAALEAHYPQHVFGCECTPILGDGTKEVLDRDWSLHAAAAVLSLLGGES